MSYKVYNNYSRYNSYNKTGGYKSLPFYIQSEIIYDFTVEFCKLYIEGKLKLLGVARGSLEELLNDYQDFLR